jgi:hypothetical protein
MHLNLSWIFSIFKVPRISRAVSGSDARNIRLRGNYFKHWTTPCYYDRHLKSGRDVTFSIQDLKTEALSSTSASIVKAGLDKVWRTKSKVSSVPLQNDNEKQPEQGIIHTLDAQPAPTCFPCPKSNQHVSHLPQTGQPEREPYIPAGPQHPSGSRFLSFSFQKTVNKPDSEQSIVRPPILETSTASCPVSQPAPVRLPNRLPNVSLGSSAAKGWESTQRNVGLNLFTAVQDPFYSPSVSSLRVTLFDFLPNTVSPAKSLLFLPPIIFNPFSPEEDIVPLPPVFEPKSNQFGAIYPIRNPDHEFPINTPPGLSSPTGNVHSFGPRSYS